jgi:Phage integrase family
MTPHTLRRTFASLLAEIGVSPRRAMYLLGHTDPKFTMRVYQQVLDLGGAAPGAARARARLHRRRSVLAAVRPRAAEPWSARRAGGGLAAMTPRVGVAPGGASPSSPIRVPRRWPRPARNGHPAGASQAAATGGLDDEWTKAPKVPGARGSSASQEREKPRKSGASARAADGIRTHDLLHGKQNEWFRVSQGNACTPAVSRACLTRGDCPEFAEKSRGFGYRMGTQISGSATQMRSTAPRRS